MASVSARDAEGPRTRQSSALVIGASSLGTIFEWYDFYLYGLLATIISAQFFCGVDETTGFIFALAAFAAGFAVRPFGAILFGRIGDLVGRKNTFLVTMGIMGLSTFVVGLLPSYASIGVAAPIALVALRLLQGLALGGEYGGAATYVAEHAPEGKRGLYTSFIQTTATLGLFAALLVVIGIRSWLGEAAFADWGWRIPFLISILLLAISLWIRLQLEESPVFREMKDAGEGSNAPLTEAFARWGNVKIVMIALVGAVAGQAVVWYTGQFYALFFLEKTLKVDGATANILIAIALALATPFFILFGWLSDKIGRKPIIMAGCALAALTYFPLFGALTAAANPALARAQASAPVRSSPTPPTARCSSIRSARTSSTRARATSPSRISPRPRSATPMSPRPPGRWRGPHRRPRHRRRRSRPAIGRRRARRRSPISRRARRRRWTRPAIPPRPIRRRSTSSLVVAHPVPPRALCDHGLRADRGAAGRAVPDAHPLHLDEPALSYRQWLVRRLPADHRLRDGRRDRAISITACGTRSSSRW